MPALARLAEADELPAALRVVGVDRGEADTATYRERIAAALDARAGQVDRAARTALLDRIEYRRADVTDGDQLARALEPAGEPMIAYLALPPALFEPVIAALAGAGVSADSRIVVEKPFGEGVDSARRLNAQLSRVVPEPAVYRVDHFLAKQTVQNLLGLRFGNRSSSRWNRHHVARVEIVWDETLTVEGRAGYYDRAGALRDMLQNHLVHLLALAAMEPPGALTERDLRDRKVDVLRSIRAFNRTDVERRTVRARYGAGSIDDRQVPAYTDEPGVDPARETERRSPP